MRIAVFVRPVHNTAMQVEPSSTRVLEELPGYRPIPNPMDELALEMALNLRESRPSAVTVSVCSVGREASITVLQEFLACGAERAVCIEEGQWEPDGAVVAGCLLNLYRAEPFDLGLFGARDLDTGAGQVGPMFAALAGIAYFDSVVAVHWKGDRRIGITRKQKRLREEISVALPACLGIQRGTPLRYPTFWGKLQAEAAQIRRVAWGDRNRDPRVGRQKFTRSKPKKGSVAEAYAACSSAERMRQALGIAGAGGSAKEDSLLRGTPEEVARKMLTILEKEKAIDTDSLSRERLSTD